MSDSNTDDELIRAEELISEGKMDEALNITRKIDEKAWMYFYARNHEEAISLGLKCKELYEKLGNKIGIALNLILLGHSNIQIGEHNAGLICGQKSLELYEELNNQKGIANSLYLMGAAYNYMGKFDQSIECCERSLAIKGSDPRTRVEALYILGIVNYWKGELDLALQYFEGGIELAEKIDYKMLIALNLNQFGEIYKTKGDFDQA
jgi:tetratricopeptide (TPR) repeat protein